MSYYQDMTVDVPEGQIDGLRVERFTVPQHSARRALLALEGRALPPGTYTRLMDGQTLWMSDTPAEKRDHMGAVWAIATPSTRRVLINGLGLGMVVSAALACEHVEHIDVVEIDQRVIDLVGPHYTRDPRVHLHCADAYQQMRAWPRGTRWDVAWSDIWSGMNADHLPGMARLRRSYAQRTDWHDCWGRDRLLLQREQERRMTALWD